MFVVTVEFEINPEHIHEFMRIMRVQADSSLELEAGCHQFDVCVDLEHYNHVFLYEVYADKEAFTHEHLTSKHFVDFDAQVKPWVTKKKVRLWNQSSV